MSELYERIDVRKAACGSAKSEIRVAREIAATIKQQADILLNSSVECKPATASFLAEILRRDPNTAEDDTVLLNLVYVVQVARVDMTGLLMWILKKMSDNREIVDELRDISSKQSEASQSAASELAAAIVKETLRLDQSEYLYRKVQDEIRFRGFVIPQGWLVRICIREGHRDPALFPDPERFDPHRFLENEFTVKAYSPLGLLGHSCLGAMLVDRVGRTFAGVLATEFDWSVISDGPREFGAAHWTTSARFRIGLQRRQALSEIPSAKWI